MSTILESVHKMVERAANRLKMIESDRQSLVEPDAVHSFEIEVNGHRHPAYRVQHSNKRGPYKGGIRFHSTVEESEIRAFALLMSLKTAAVGIPMGGGKGGVVINPQDYDDKHIEAVSRAYVRHLKDVLGPDHDVPAPDVNTNAKIMDWMVEEFEKISGDTSKASFTGKSIGNKGSKGRERATGHGGAVVLRQYFESIGRNYKDLTVAVQGVGNVGFWFTKSAEKMGFRVVAISDSKRSLVVKDFKNNMDRLSLEHVGQHKRGLIEDMSTRYAEFRDRDELLGLEVDVLVLAALGDVFTEDNWEEAKTSTILELANGPVTDEANTEFYEEGVNVVPDIIANAGGVTVSYLEWLQNIEDESWSESKVISKMEQILGSSTKRMVEIASQEKCSLKEAAFIMALQELNQDVG